jgi:GNAT superfamily N-acetyltransferase
MNPADHVGAIDVTTEEVDLRSITPHDVATWTAYDTAMLDEAPETPFDARRFSLLALPEFVTLRLFVARDPDGSIAGDARAVFSDTGNNTEICQAHIGVRRDRRRQGIATRLLRHVAAAADRPLVVGWSFDHLPAGAAFAERIGAEAAIHQHVNRLWLFELDRPTLRAWSAAGPVRASGYSLKHIDGPYPDELIGEIAALRTAIDPAHQGAFRLEPPMLSVDQIRSLERVILAQGSERRALVAIHESSGAVAGFTEMGFEAARPALAQQWTTVVRPGHRGRGLGKWLKAAMLERMLAERPGVEEVRTANAATNEPMLAINRALGFKPYIGGTGWQVPVSRLRDYLSSRGAAITPSTR